MKISISIESNVEGTLSLSLLPKTFIFNDFGLIFCLFKMSIISILLHPARPISKTSIGLTPLTTPDFFDLLSKKTLCPCVFFASNR